MILSHEIVVSQVILNLHKIMKVQNDFYIIYYIENKVNHVIKEVVKRRSMKYIVIDINMSVFFIDKHTLLKYLSFIVVKYPSLLFCLNA